MVTDKHISDIKLICFDMDGTIYTSEGILLPSYHTGIDSFNAKYNMNLAKPSLEELEHQIGQPVRIIFQNLFPELTGDERLQELSKLVLDFFLKEISNKGGRLFPDVYSTLEQLKGRGYSLAIASNGRKEYLKEILNAFNLEHFFLPLVAIDEQEITEKAHILQNYMSVHSVSSEEILMIGDRSSDLEASEKIQCPFIGCSYGFASNEIEKAEIIVTNIKQILDYI